MKTSITLFLLLGFTGLAMINNWFDGIYFIVNTAFIVLLLLFVVSLIAQASRIKQRRRTDV